MCGKSIAMEIAPATGTEKSGLMMPKGVFCRRHHRHCPQSQTQCPLSRCHGINANVAKRASNADMLVVLVRGLNRILHKS